MENISNRTFLLIYKMAHWAFALSIVRKIDKARINTDLTSQLKKWSAAVLIDMVNLFTCFTKGN